MKTLKNFGFTSWYIIIAATLITALLDYVSWVTVQGFGGFSEWTAKNPFWDAACAYSCVWHFMYIMTIVMVFLENKNEA